MNNLKRIYWFAYYNEDSPSVRYRGKFPLETFKNEFGIDGKLVIPGYHPLRIFKFLKSYLSVLFTPRKNKLIVIQRVHSNFIYSSLLKLLVTLNKNNTVYDLDDADYLYCPSESIYYFARKCQHISAGSQEIANHLRKFNSNICITPSPTPDLGILKTHKNDKLNIGWIGGFGGDHKKSLIEIVFPAIKELDFECEVTILGVTKEDDFKFIEAFFANNRNITLQIPRDIDWRNEVNIQYYISQFDVGVATLVDNEIQRSKSGIKAKQYLNNGIPVLGTQLPENDWVIKHGINGYFCKDSKDFSSRLTQFQKMPQKEFDSFSKNCRNSTGEFNHELYCSKFLSLSNQTA